MVIIKVIQNINNFLGNFDKVEAYQPYAF